MVDECVILEKKGPIAIITLNRPEKRNALNIPLLEQMNSIISELNQDSSMRILIFLGAGPVFCSGLDLQEAKDTTCAKYSGELIAALLSLINQSPHITIAAVHGAAIAGGAGLMCACDFSIAADNTIINFPEITKGLIPALILTLLIKKLNETHLKELLLLGKPISAERALFLGLITKTCAMDDHFNQALSLAKQALNGGPEAIKRTKALMENLQPSSLADLLNIALKEHEHTRNSSEAQEGIAAFREKRPTNWSDKYEI